MQCCILQQRVSFSTISGSVLYKYSDPNFYFLAVAEKCKFIIFILTGFAIEGFKYWEAWEITEKLKITNGEKCNLQ